jgi:glycosyltransferase involved in cell wall biosynthesis
MTAPWDDVGTSPLVSVIVPSKNSASTIGRCLESIRRQEYKNLEVIAVDNFSKDDTVRIAKEAGATVYVHGNERSSQINYGVERSHGEFVYRVDSDLVLDSDVIAQATRKCLEHGFDGIVVRTVSDKNRSVWGLIHSLEQGNYYTREDNVAVTFLSRSAFLMLGGFDEELVAGEDYDLHNRFVARGLRYGRIDAKELHLGEPLRLLDVAKKHYYYGRTIRPFVRKNARSALRQLGFVRVLVAVKDSGFPIPARYAFYFLVYQVVRFGSTAAGVASSLVMRTTSTRTRSR